MAMTFNGKSNESTCVSLRLRCGLAVDRRLLDVVRVSVVDETRGREGITFSTEGVLEGFTPFLGD
jgi:hypothetical protein